MYCCLICKPPFTLPFSNANKPGAGCSVPYTRTMGKIVFLWKIFYASDKHKWYWQFTLVWHYSTLFSFLMGSRVHIGVCRRWTCCCIKSHKNSQSSVRNQFPQNPLLTGSEMWQNLDKVCFNLLLDHSSHFFDGRGRESQWGLVWLLSTGSFKEYILQKPLKQVSAIIRKYWMGRG